MGFFNLIGAPALGTRRLIYLNPGLNWPIIHWGSIRSP